MSVSTMFTKYTALSPKHIGLHMYLYKIIKMLTLSKYR